jgi:hypothetical protein
MTRIIGIFPCKTSHLIKLHDVVSKFTGFLLAVFSGNTTRIKSSPENAV